MNEPLSKDAVAHIARLARLELGEEELSRFAGQLSAVLEHVEAIQKLDTADVLPTSHPFELVNVLRDDERAACLPREAVLAAAPATEAGRFRVPRILGEAP